MSRSNEPTNVTWITGYSLDSRDRLLLQYLHPSTSNHPNFISIVPSRRRAQFFLNKYPSSWLPHVFILPELIETFYSDFQFNTHPKKILSNAEKNYLLAEVITYLQKDLEYFSDIISPTDPESWMRYPGVIDQISKFISVLKENHMGEGFIQRIILDDDGNAGVKDHDLTLIYNRYVQLLEDSLLVDREEQSFVLCKLLDKGHVPVILQGKKTLVLDHPTFLNPLGEKLILALLPLFQEIVCIIDYPKCPSSFIEEISSGREKMDRLSHRIFSPTQSFFNILADSDKFTQRHLFENNDIHNISHNGIWFFQQKSNIEVPHNINKEEKVYIFGLHNRIEEVRYICRKIKWYFDQGVSLSKIHVIFPRMEKYVSAIYELFPEYGIPFSITRGLELNSSPIAIVVKSILEIPKAFDRNHLFRFFSSNLVTFREPIDKEEFGRFIDQSGISENSTLMSRDEILDRYDLYEEEQKIRGILDAHFDVNVLDRFSRSANIRGGYDLIKDWFLPLDRIYFAPHFQGSFQNEEERENIKRKYFLVLRQLFFLDKVRDLFRPLREEIDPQKILDQMKYLVHYFHIPRNLTRRIQNLPDLSERDKIFLLRRDISALQSVFGILDDLYEICLLKNRLKNFQVNNFQEPIYFISFLLSEQFSKTYILDPLDEHVVQITETLEVRGIDFDYCFFGGLTAEDYPRKKPLDFILPDTPNAFFRQLNPLDESRYIFSYILKNTKKTLFLSYPRVQGDQEVEASSFLEDLRAFDSTIGEPDPFPDRSIFSNSELEEWVGSKVPLDSGEWPKSWNSIMGEFSDPHKISEKIQSELSRKCNQYFGAYDGCISPDSSKSILKEKPVFSISQLNNFAACPQHFFYKKTLGLEPLDEITDEMEADEYGSYVHDILERFYKKWISKNNGKISNSNLGEAIALMRDVSQEVLGKREKNVEFILWDRQRLRIVGGLEEGYDAEKSPPGILRKFLEYEAEGVDLPFRPVSIEEKFGFGSDKVNIGGVFLRGILDRVDRFNSSSESVDGYFVIDYKTGKIPEQKQILSGLNFQLPIYLMALKEKTKTLQVGAAYYQLNDPYQVQIRQSIMTEVFRDEDYFGEGIPRSTSGRNFLEWMPTLYSNWVSKIVNQIESGTFHYAFEEVLCPFCDFKNICRRDEERGFRISQNENNYYIPKNNYSEFKKVISFYEVTLMAKNVLKAKEGSKSKRLGSKQKEIPNVLRSQFGKLSEKWQEYFKGSYDEILETWNGIFPPS